jgi:hypothetical protein
MEILSESGDDLLALWSAKQTWLRVEVVSGNVAFWFSGVVVSYSNVEIVIGKDTDQLSISTFFATCRIFRPPGGNPSTPSRADYGHVVQIVTDGGAQCTIYEPA